METKLRSEGLLLWCATSDVHDDQTKSVRAFVARWVNGAKAKASDVFNALQYLRSIA